MYFFIGTVLLSYTYPFNALCKVKLWLLDLERDFFPKQIYSTSRPKARDGLRYPSPALWFARGSLLCKQGFGPKGGRSPVEHRGNLYVCTSSPGVLIGCLKAFLRVCQGLSGLF